MTNLNEVAINLVKGDYKKVKELVQKCIEDGLPAEKILNEGLIAGMNIVGEKFKNNEFYIPEVLVAARAMRIGMELLKPILKSSDTKLKGKFVIGTVKGDLHDIGKNLVAMMIEGAGFEVVDLGIDVPAEKFVEITKIEKPQILGMSALLTTTMQAMKKTIEKLKQAGIRDKVKVIVGGAPITQRFADEIGADGYAPDAASAVELVKKLLSIQ
jgi:5-methyltetrahydrofolate--homocysteine methyltransferase